MSFWAIRDLDRKSYLSYIKPEWLSFHSGMDIINRDFDFKDFVKSRKQARTMFFRIFKDTENEHDASFVSAREVLFDLVWQIADTINDEEGYENLLYYIRHPRDERVKEDTTYEDLFSVIFGELEVTPSISFLDHFLISFIEDDGCFLSGKEDINHALYPGIPSTKSLFRGPKEFFSVFCQYLYQNHCSLYRLSRLWYLACYDDFYLTESSGKDIRQTKNFCRFFSYRREAIHRRQEILSTKVLSDEGSHILFFNPSEMEVNICYAYQSEIARRLGGYLLPERTEEKKIPSLFPFRMIIKGKEYVIREDRGEPILLDDKTIYIRFSKSKESFTIVSSPYDFSISTRRSFSLEGSLGMEILLGFASSEVSLPDNLLCYRYMSDEKELEEALTEGKYRVCFSKVDKRDVLHEYQSTVHQEEKSDESNTLDLHPDNIHILSFIHDYQDPFLWNHSVACVEYQFKDFFSSLQKNMESTDNDAPFYLFITGDVRTEDKQMNLCGNQYFHSCYSNRLGFVMYCIDCFFKEEKESKTNQEYRIMFLDSTPGISITCKPQRYYSKDEASSLSSTFTTTIPHSILN